MKPIRLFAALCLGLWVLSASAQVPAPSIAARAFMLIDVGSGQILAASEPDRKVEPASLTKLMTAYIAFGALRDGRLSAEQRPPVSQAAWKAIGSRMFVDPGKPARVDELLRGMIVQSGNDASIILAEAIAGSEEAFVARMNQEAQRMGLTNTQFRNATGLPDPQHYTTARDLATLSTRLIAEFPQSYGLYAEREYTYNNIRQPNRNRLLFIDPSVDGLKTGHTEAAGYCLVASSRREQPGTGVQRRLLSVILGAGSEAARVTETQRLLNHGFQGFDAVRIFAKDQAAGSYPVWKGSTGQLRAGFDGEVSISVPRGQAGAIRAEIERTEPLVAPIAKGQRIGTLRVRLGDQTIAERPLLAMSAVEPSGWLGRAWDGVRMSLGR